MGVIVRIPGPLRQLTKGEEKVEVEVGNLLRIIEMLDSRFPGIKERLVDEGGDLRYFVNLYLNMEDARFLQGMETPTTAGDEVSIVPAVAGG